MQKIALILAGGKGTRLWPISTAQTPKQLLPLLSPNALVVDTINRIHQNFRRENIFIITSLSQSSKMRTALNNLIPSENILSEPLSKGTSACILLALTYIKKLHRDCVVSIFASDSSIEDEDQWNKTIAKSLSFAEKNSSLITIGIKPTKPDTHYGYIQKGSPISRDFFKVKQFIEKPSLTLATQFYESDDYLWNSGCLIAKLSLLFSSYKKHLPKIYNKIIDLSKKLSANPDLDPKPLYSQLENIPIDKGITEKTDRLVVIEAPVKWQDIGTLKKLVNLTPTDSSNNYSNRPSLKIETSNTYIYSKDKFVITLGINNLVIIENNGLILVVQKDDLDKVPSLLNKPELKEFL